MSGPKFNILFVASSSGTLGYHLVNLAMGLKKIGHDVSVISGSGEQIKGLSAKLREMNIAHFINNCVDSLNFFSICKGCSGINRILETKDFDIIHANGAIHALHTYLGSTLSHRKPAIATSVHSIPRDSSYLLQKTKRIVTCAVLNKISDIILPVSNYTKTQLMKHGIDLRKTKTLYNAIDLEAFDKACKEAQIDLGTKSVKGPNIVCVGNLIPVKGHEYYLIAAAKILKKCKATFYVIGDGPRREHLKRLAQSLGIESEVRFVGRILWPQIYWVLSNVADICVSSSLSENFPFYILECMASAKPIVATNVGGVPEAVIDGINGYLVSPKDPNSLAQAILKLIKNPTKAKEMGLKGRSILEKRFSMNVIISRLQEVYKTIMGNY